MILELGQIPVKDIAWGEKTLLDGGVLRIHREELIEKTRGDDARLASVEADIARPGESVRIIPVKDVIEPRVKVTACYIVVQN